MTKPRTNPWMGPPCPDCEAHREEIKELKARVEGLEEGHCRDCCCARAWEALDVAEYDGKSIPEHIILLRNYAAEQCDLAADRKDEIRLMKRHDLNEIKRLQARVEELEEVQEVASAGLEGWRKESIRLRERVQELEDDVREGVEVQVRYVAEITRLREALEGVPEVLFPLPGHVRRETVVETLRDYVDAALEEKP